jgi:hypothetical protein
MPETSPYEHQEAHQHLIDLQQMIAELESKENKHPQDVETLKMLHKEHDQLQEELGETIH